MEIHCRRRRCCAAVFGSHTLGLAVVVLLPVLYFPISAAAVSRVVVFLKKPTWSMRVFTGVSMLPAKGRLLAELLTRRESRIFSHDRLVLLQMAENVGSDTYVKTAQSGGLGDYLVDVRCAIDFQSRQRFLFCVF